MFKKIITLLAAGIMGFSFAHAQDFDFVFTNPVHDSTGGTAVYQAGDMQHSYIEIKNYIKNTTADSIVVYWRYIDIDTTVNASNAVTLNSKWFVTGICDNQNCRGEFGSWYYGSIDSSAKVAPNGTMLIMMHVYVPVNSPDATQAFKVELQSLNQTDTAVFVVTKVHGLGISAIQLKDRRVSIYPNPLPAGQKMNLYIDKNLKAAHAEVFNIIGQKLMTLPLATAKEVQSFNINNLTSGMYIVKITDAGGNVITSRKFSKQ
jgi:hypothetical protein